MLPVVCGSSVFVLLCVALCPFWFCSCHGRGRGGLVALLLLKCGCVVAVSIPWCFLAVLWVGLQCVIVVFPDHTHLLFGRNDI